jgi:hypothetical protein
MMKAMVAQAMVQQQAEMRATRQAIWVLEAKFELFCKEKFGIQFHERTKTPKDMQRDGAEESRKLTCTQANPITVDEEEERLESNKNARRRLASERGTQTIQEAMTTLGSLFSQG